MSEPEFVIVRRKVRGALAVTAAVWVIWRVAASPVEPPPAVWRALEEVRAAGSSETGRIELRGWPEALVDLGLAEIPEVRAAAYHLESQIDDANDSLANLAAFTASRIERIPDGPIGIRMAGMLVTFSGRDAERLDALAGADRGRGRETLVGLSDLLEARLEEPPPLEQLEGTVEHRELADLHRTVRDAVEAKDAEIQESLAEFRRESFEAVRGGSGPFQRRGRGVVLETVIAALLGVLLRESLRVTASASPPQLAVALGPLAALGVVIGLAGVVIPAHPVRGLSPVFVPIAFVIGWVTPGLLTLLSKWDRPSEARERQRARVERRLTAVAEYAPPPAPSARAAAPRAAATPEPAASPVPPRVATSERLPFARKLRTR